MIKTNGQIFLLETDELSYVFHVNESGLLIHDYFGSKITIDDFDISAINKKETCAKGTTAIYDQKEEQLSMETALLEFSFPHKGDFKTTPILLNNASHGYVFDFSFKEYEITKLIKNKYEFCNRENTFNNIYYQTSKIFNWYSTFDNSKTIDGKNYLKDISFSLLYSPDGKK